MSSVFHVLVLAILGGGAAVFVKQGVQELPPLIFTLLRFFVALLLFIPVLVRQWPGFDHDFKKLVVYSFLSTGNIVFFAYGVKTTTAVSAQMLYALVPILTIIVLFLLFKKKSKFSQWVGVLAGLVGSALIVLLPILDLTNPYFGDVKGNTLILIGVISFTLYALLIRQFQSKYSTEFITAIFVLVTFVSLIIPAVIESQQNPEWYEAIDKSVVFAILFTGFFSTWLWYWVYQHALKAGSALVTATNFYLQPVFTLGWAYMILGEELTLTFAMASVLVFAGVWLVTKQGVKYSYETN